MYSSFFFMGLQEFTLLFSELIIYHTNSFLVKIVINYKKIFYVSIEIIKQITKLYKQSMASLSSLH